MNIKEFNEYCGVGVVVTAEQIKQTVQAVIDENKNELVQKRYKFPIGSLLGTFKEKICAIFLLIFCFLAELRKRIKWADGKLVKTELDAQVLNLLGPKTEQDNVKEKKVTFFFFK